MDSSLVKDERLLGSVRASDKNTGNVLDFPSTLAENKHLIMEALKTERYENARRCLVALGIFSKLLGHLDIDRGSTPICYAHHVHVIQCNSARVTNAGIVSIIN
jgi:hypothetical protein